MLNAIVTSDPYNICITGLLVMRLESAELQVSIAASWKSEELHPLHYEVFSGQEADRQGEKNKYTDLVLTHFV